MPETLAPPLRTNGVQQQPLIVIEPTSGWRLVDWRELVAYRDLFWLLAMRDVSVRYKQTVLGFGWVLIRPFFSKHGYGASTFST